MGHRRRAVVGATMGRPLGAAPLLPAASRDAQASDEIPPFVSRIVAYTTSDPKMHAVTYQ